MREWAVVAIGLLVFAGATALALRGYRAPPPLSQLVSSAPRATPGAQTEPAGTVGAVQRPDAIGTPAAAVGRPMNACVAGGVATYTDRSCPAGSISRRVIVTEPNTYAPAAAPAVDMNRYVPVTPPPSSTGMDTERGDAFGPSQPGSECRRIESEIRRIDEAGRRGYTGNEGVRLSEERRRLRERYHALNCCTAC